MASLIKSDRSTSASHEGKAKVLKFESSAKISISRYFRRPISRLVRSVESFDQSFRRSMRSETG